MPIHTLNATQALLRLADFDCVIDARSEDEYALDHLFGALNWPTLHNAERAHIGTLYKQVSAFEARKHGAVVAARNIAAHIEREIIGKPKHWRALLYCWRGGQRSGALATVLGAIGFQITLIEGGYKAWRAALLADLPAQAARLRYRVLCGPTGSGKTRLLQALAAQGAQVLDLEALACHRSSVLGHVPGRPQPSQKAFDSHIWHALRHFDPARPVFLESESKKVGNLHLPDALVEAMRASPCTDLQLATAERVELLLQDYDYFVQDPAFFCRRLHALTQACGKSVVEHWIELVQRGQTAAVVEQLLRRHYDPLYAQSMARHFSRFAQTRDCVVLHDRSAASLQAAARRLLEQA
ncbi:tRNA 2-selenouridine(34) synthase MnmH [Hydrogenophaga sp.]|uniref:tRNA 2-selenouridine(34) synthase MnmH n=1 Tax=Hydrogenophaga sp. TaxID=1904254 RepID=UPI0019B4BDC9|nr:tRNA 2-selenouridine(34) synthase MnmH [Hydrogenophaga sp.]MBD3893686.1 tRNA 2-selenouridine(34) synthase MnmH [Hydrogenophaga sp.]